MLTQEEKLHIIEKAEFELETKKSLSERKVKKSSWLNRKISLLLISALITGVLVPWFQFTQKTIEWKMLIIHTGFQTITDSSCAS